MKQRVGTQSKKQLRNLKQYEDMSDEEFDAIFANKGAAEINYEALEADIEKRLVEFEEDYDLSDMKINDRIVLRNLVVSMISLEALEEQFVGLRENLSDANILLIDRTSSVMSKLRHDISDMQNDLKLTRKIRKDSQEENFMTWLANTKEKAAKFYKKKHLYIFCPECRRLLATVWKLYPDELDILELQCGNKECNHHFTVLLADLYDAGNRNLDDVEIP
jgi:hypothetical protein